MSNKKHPNFLIVGAAKAGTTSIAKYLEEHPEIFISKEKEPFYFVRDSFNKIPKEDLMLPIIEKKFHTDSESYFSLFDGVTEKRSGEASVHYLYHHDEVIPKVKEELGDVHIIIVLRDPANRAFSNYTYQQRVELDTFEKALAKEGEKKAKGWNSFWYYKDQGNYSESVQAYLSAFSNVHVCLFDDLKKDSSSFMKSMYSFLDVDPTFEPNLEQRHNPTLAPKNKIVQFFFYLKIKYRIRLGLPSFMKRKIMKASMKTSNQKINPETRQMLRNYYKTDILKLEIILNKDLSGWYD
ncbi:MAG: sulfotransferase [Crocinitomicaceae bacterium]|nr:sulfotransferase [Crocinitomicaceae bacterium]